MADAAKLAVKHVNEAGGVLGKQVEFVLSDTQTDPIATKDAMDQLVNVQRVPVIVGPATSGNSKAALESAKQGKVVLISPSATSPDLSTIDDDGFFFRTAPSDALQGAVMAKLAYDEGFRKAATLAINNDYGQAFAKVFVESFQERGGEVVAQLQYDPQGTTFTSEINRLAEASPDVVIFIGYPDKGSVVLREAYQQGLLSQTTFLLSEGMQSDTLADDVGKDESGKYIIEGMRGTRPKAEGPMKQAFVDAFTQEYGKSPSGPFDAHTYDAAILAMLAMEKAGKADGTAIRDAVRAVSSPPGQKVSDVAEALKLIREGKDIDFEGASGNLNHNEVGDVLSNYEIWEVTSSGKTQVVGEVTVDE